MSINTKSVISAISPVQKSETEVDSSNKIELGQKNGGQKLDED